MATVGLASLLTATAQKADGAATAYNDLPFEMRAVAEPKIPDYEVRLTDFGVFLFNMFFRRFLRYFCRPGIFGIGLLHIALIRCDAAVFLFRKVPEHTEQKQKHNYR